MQNAEFITIFYGNDVTEEGGAEGPGEFCGRPAQRRGYPALGGQPVYYYMISAE
jgi:hypothetical protein